MKYRIIITTILSLLLATSTAVAEAPRVTGSYKANVFAGKIINMAVGPFSDAQTAIASMSSGKIHGSYKATVKVGVIINIAKWPGACSQVNIASVGYKSC